MPVRTRTGHQIPEQDDGKDNIAETNRKSSTRRDEGINSPAQALDVLKSHPSRDALFNVLQWLQRSKSSQMSFDINGQTPQAAQIIHALVNDVLPNHWSNIREGTGKNARKLRDLVMFSLSNVAGISSIVTRMRSLIAQKDNEGNKYQMQLTGRAELLEEALSILEYLLVPDSFISSNWSKLTALFPTPARRASTWKELVTLLAGGRVLSIASEVDDIVTREASNVRERSWLSNGGQYSTWIGRNMNHFLSESTERTVDMEKAWTQMLERALNLGHIDQVVEATYGELIHGENQSKTVDHSITMALKSSIKRTVLCSLLRVLGKNYLSSPTVLPSEEADIRIRGVAAVLHEFIRNSDELSHIVREWLSSDGVLQGIQIRRAVIALIAENTDNLKTALSDSLSAFGDKIHIKHTPILHQEGTTENLLLLAGYVHRNDPQYLVRTSQSSAYLNVISNRIAASSPRASALGMYVGTAISELVDPVDKRMNFSSEALTTPEGRRYLGLTKVQDRVGSVNDLQSLAIATKTAKKPAQQNLAAGRAKPIASINQVTKSSKIVSIEEIESESDSEDDDLPTYAKPDSDPSDSDEDPTVIIRGKPTAPVYINDLIAGLRDTENYDRHTLALTHASSLIRRKASFGTEVTDNTHELASILTGLTDKWDFTNFQELRLQAMIAVLVAQPLEMGQWFSSSYFNGDYSISQRAAVLTTLGLGARELAGYGKEDAALTKSNQVSRDTAFPSKQLPQKLHALYASADMAPLTAASKQLEQSILRPMALNAADALTGPNALKIRTFSSRMEVEKKRTKPIPNALAKVVADGFFLPLTGRWSMHVQGFGTSTPLLLPPLLPLFLRTLSLLLHASGPSTLSLPLLTSEFFPLILSLRTRASNDLPTLEALLFAFLTVLEVNGDREGQRRLAGEHGREMLEMNAFVEGVFERVRGDGEEEGKVRMLAAGCIGRVRDCAEKEEMVLMGDLAGFM